MRWPNRNPHRLTDGMRAEQGKLARFLPEIDWLSFRREGVDVEAAADGQVHAMACGDDRQALVYLLRGDALGPDGMLDRAAPALAVDVSVPGLADGHYRVTLWDTVAGEARERVPATSHGGVLRVTVTAFRTDLILAIRPAP
jgi:mannan endo-1,4-beta-mannosidase